MAGLTTNTSDLRKILELLTSKASGNAPTLINFKYGSTTYTAEQGMTWYEWINSVYVAGSFTCLSASSTVYVENGEFTLANSSMVSVTGSDEIIANETYQRGL